MKEETSENKQQSHSFDEALELVGFGWSQVFLMAVSGLVIMTIVSEAMGTSFIVSVGSCELGLSPGQKGLVEGAIFLGILVPSYFWGYLVDILGRQMVMKYTLVGASICSALASFADGFGWLMALRFLAGFLLSAPSGAIYAYLGEFCSEKRRVQVVSLASALAPFGIVFAAAIGWWILSYDWRLPFMEGTAYRPWRLLFIFYTSPGLLAGIAMFFSPESPKFLHSRGREREALDVLKKLHRINNGDKPYDVIALNPADDEVYQKVQEGLIGVLHSIKDQTVPLLKLPHCIYFLVSCFQCISTFAVYGGIGLWFPHIMNEVFSPNNSTEHDTHICLILQRHPPSTNSTICNDDHVDRETFIYTLGLGCFGVVYYLLMALVLSRFSCQTMKLFNMVVAGVVGIVLQFVSHGYALAVLICVEIMFAFHSVTLVKGHAVLLFPTHFQGLAVALINMVGRLACFLASYVIGLYMAPHCSLIFYCLSGMLFVSAALTFLLPSSSVEKKSTNDVACGLPSNLSTNRNELSWLPSDRIDDPRLVHWKRK